MWLGAGMDERGRGWGCAREGGDEQVRVGMRVRAGTREWARGHMSGGPRTLERGLGRGCAREHKCVREGPRAGMGVRVQGRACGGQCASAGARSRTCRGQCAWAGPRARVRARVGTRMRAGTGEVGCG